MTAASLWARLKAEGLVEGELPQNRADSPWYPTMRLYRQAAVGRWDEVVDQVLADLDARR